jgi:hypothetical protein
MKNKNGCAKNFTNRLIYCIIININYKRYYPNIRASIYGLIKRLISECRRSTRRGGA